MKKLLNPIEFISDKKLFFINLAFFIAGTGISVFMRSWFVSIFQMFFRTKIDGTATILENITLILLLAFAFYLSGKIINKKTRFIDCLNLSMYTRIPFYIMSLSNIVDSQTNSTPVKNPNGSINIPPPENTIDYSILMLSSILNVIILIFLILTIYRSFKTLSNAKKTSDYVIFFGIVFLTTILSPYLLNLFNR